LRHSKQAGYSSSEERDYLESEGTLLSQVDAKVSSLQTYVCLNGCGSVSSYKASYPIPYPMRKKPINPKMLSQSALNVRKKYPCTSLTLQTEQIPKIPYF